MPSAPTGEGGGGRRTAVAARAAAIGLAAAAALAACSGDQPALTLAFENVPAGTTGIQVTLHAADVTFAGPDASSGDVAVSYAGGDVVIAVDGAFAERHGNRIRLPLTAATDIPRLDGVARASGGVENRTAQAWTAVAAHQSATLGFDFSAGVDADAGNPDGGGADPNDGGGAPDTADAGAGADVADAHPDAPPVDAPPDAAPPDGPPDAPVEMPVDAPADMTVGPTDAPADTPPAPDVAPDAPIPTACTVATPRPASSSVGGGGPALAATPAGLYGLAWKSVGDILYNSFTDAGGLQNAADITVVSAGTKLLGDPQLARVGSQLVVAHGVRESTGFAYVEAVKIEPQAGQMVARLTTGGGASSDTLPAIVGGIAVAPDQASLGIVSRRASASARTPAELVRMGAALTTIGSVQPAALAMTWTNAVAWASAAARPDRFVIASILDGGATGGTLLDVAAPTLVPGAGTTFTGPGDAPLAGGAGATVAVAGLGDAVAVVWVDDHTGAQDVWLAVVDLASGTRRGTVQVSAGGPLTKQYPKVVFDGAALAVAWLEVLTGVDSRIWLRRFDPGLPAPAPLGPALPIGAAGIPTFGDIGLAAAGPGKYGIAFSRSGSPGTKLFSAVDCR